MGQGDKQNIWGVIFVSELYIGLFYKYDLKMWLRVGL